MTLLPSVTNCESANGVPVTVTGVAQVKIMTENDDYLSTACEQFLGKSEQEIQDLLLETFEGHLRAIVGTMEVEELFQDRETFAHNVREVAATDVSKMGIKILSFTIKELKDAEGYLDAIGQEQTANIKSKATIEKAEADRDAFIQEQECSKNAMDKKYQVDTSIADFEKEFKTKEAAAIEAIGKAEAQEMELKAAAYKQYGEAAKMKLVLDALPKIAAEVAAPLAKVDEIVIVGGGGGGGFTNETTKLLAELPQTVKAVTGYDISGLIGKIPGAVKVK